MARHQEMIFVLNLVVWICIIAGVTGRRSCPVERQAVDICTEGTVTASETLLIDFSPETGIYSCNCNFTIDGDRVNVTTLVAPQTPCDPQLEIELGQDYFQASCDRFSDSYSIPEIKKGLIWTTTDAFNGVDPPQDLCLEWNVHGGASTVSITCAVESVVLSTTTESVDVVRPLPENPSDIFGPLAETETATSSSIVTKDTVSTTIESVTLFPEVVRPLPEKPSDIIGQNAEGKSVTLLPEVVRPLPENPSDIIGPNAEGDSVTLFPEVVRPLPENPSNIVGLGAEAESGTLSPEVVRPLPEKPSDIFGQATETETTTSSSALEITASTTKESVTLFPEVIQPLPEKPSDIFGFPEEQEMTTSSADSGTAMPPDSIRDEILKLANNAENPVVFENNIFLLNDTDMTLMDSPPMETTSEAAIVEGSSTTSVPTVPPKDIMDQLLEAANATSNPIQIELPSSTPIQHDTSLDEITTTSAPQPMKPVRSFPRVPPTEVMDQLLDMANNGTNDTIVFPDFPGGDGILDTFSTSTQIPEQTTTAESTVIFSETSTTPQMDIDTTTQPISISTTQQQTTSVHTDTTKQSDSGSSTTSEQNWPDAEITTSSDTTSQASTTTTEETTTTMIIETTSKQPTETTTFKIYSTTGYDEVTADIHGGDWFSQPDSTTTVDKLTSTESIRTGPRGDIEITPQTDIPETISLPETTPKPIIPVTRDTDDTAKMTTLSSTDDVTSARNDTVPDDNQKGAEDTLVVIIVGSIIGIIVIVTIIAMIRAFCKSRRKSANITMMEKGGLENGSGATSGIDNPLVQLQQEQEMVETNPNPVIIESDTQGSNGKMEANFSEGATEMNGNGVSISPQAKDVP
ncbi:uncharacterized protein [Argopecten irradians]|uniref:uncharacterized protein isoform X2 n=1 Tax=Argopecten irradians TaxID=31199 RepID=UPI0037243012